MVIQLKDNYCRNYISLIKEKIKDEFEEYFLGSPLANQISGQIDESARKIYYSVIKEIRNKHHDKIISEYTRRISELKEDNQAHFRVMWAIRRLFKRGILSLREDRNIEVLSGDENVIKYLLAISNYIIIKGKDENHLAFLDQVDFSGCSKDAKELQDLLYKVNNYCSHIYRLHYKGKEDERRSEIEKLVNFLANKNLIRFNGSARGLKEKLQEVIDLILTLFFESPEINSLDYADFLIRQIFGQNLLFEILVFTKFIKFGLPALPKCKIQGRYYGDITEFDVVVLIEKLKDEPILLVEVTTRGAFENLRNKIERILKAYNLLKEEFSSETFIPLIICCKESVEHIEKIINAFDESKCEKSPIILFDFDEFFFDINNEEKFLDKLKERYGL